MEYTNRLGAPLSLIRRPSGFGKTCFAMMNVYYHSALGHSNMFRAMFGATKIMSSPNGLPRNSGRLTLLFDLVEVSDGPVKDFKTELQLYVHSRVLVFLAHHAGLYEMDVNTGQGLPACLMQNGCLCIEGIRVSVCCCIHIVLPN